MPLGVPKVPHQFYEEEDAVWLEVFNKLYEERLLFLMKPVDDEIGNQLVSIMVYLTLDDQSRDQCLFIHCTGGSVIPGIGIYDTMQYVTPDVYTTVAGLAASMGSLILAGGLFGYRMAFPHAKVMIHQPASSYSSGLSKACIQNDSDLTLVRELIMEIYIEKTNQNDRSVVWNDLDRDLFMPVKEALTYGLIDVIANKHMDLLPFWLNPRFYKSQIDKNRHANVETAETLAFAFAGDMDHSPLYIYNRNKYVETLGVTGNFVGAGYLAPANGANLIGDTIVANAKKTNGRVGPGHSHDPGHDNGDPSHDSGQGNGDPSHDSGQGNGDPSHDPGKNNGSHINEWPLQLPNNYPHNENGSIWISDDDHPRINEVPWISDDDDHPRINGVPIRRKGGPDNRPPTNGAPFPRKGGPDNRPPTNGAPFPRKGGPDDAPGKGGPDDAPDKGGPDDDPDKGGPDDDPHINEWPFPFPPF
uniref:ATP-dependent Clp protease proteolytic subunit n=1 Tax=Pherosphaera fitzgeraldii TaxID=56896 RepID=A0A3Q9WTI9_9CONI|nr:clp protease proteolytic subunit [Pherosphaera fitzgeraldii]BBF91054.1 ATP-dependent Clp protease proteolytic subunit [Pherosphaera fitzgeraldii]